MIFFAALLGFSSYLTPGNINIALLELAATRRIKMMWILFASALIAEMVYCVAVLLSLPFLHSNPEVSLGISVLIVLTFVVLGVWNFARPSAPSEALEQSEVNKAFFALLIHPQQIPFWLLWGSFGLQAGIDLENRDTLIQFCLLNALGVAAILLIYMVSGDSFRAFFQRKKHVMRMGLGVLCFCFAAVECWRAFGA